MRNTVFFFLGALTFGCGSNGHDSNGDAATGGDGAVGEECTAGTRLVYALDHYGQFSKFDPETRAFHDLGLIPCPNMSTNPYSMAIDRNGLAWVMYADGQLFTLDTETLACTPTTWDSMGMIQFGMAFTDDDVGGGESLYFIGAGNPPLEPTLTLQKIDTATLTPTSLAPMQGTVELAGVGTELWGLYINPDTSRLDQLDKVTGAVLRTIPLPTFSGYPDSEAFTYWGGDFWIFARITPEVATTVYQIDAITGAIKNATPTTGRSTIGAGVSACRD